MIKELKYREKTNKLACHLAGTPRFHCATLMYAIGFNMKGTSPRDRIRKIKSKEEQKSRWDSDHSKGGVGIMDINRS